MPAFKVDAGVKRNDPSALPRIRSESLFMTSKSVNTPTRKPNSPPNIWFGSVCQPKSKNPSYTADGKSGSEAPPGLTGPSHKCSENDGTTYKGRPQYKKFWKATATE